MSSRREFNALMAANDAASVSAAPDETREAGTRWEATAIALRDQLVASARRCIRDSAEAEDAADEAIARLAAAIERGERIDRPGAWLMRATLRLAIDRARHWLRRHRPDWLRGLEAHTASRRSTTRTPGARLERDELRERVWALVLDLPARQREVLILRQWDELSYSEIGALLSISESAARAHCFSARERLRGRLSGWL